MNLNDLTLDGYFAMDYGSRLSAAHVVLPHTADRWEGEQHVNPKQGGIWMPSYPVTDQDKLWKARLWVTLCGSGASGSVGYVSAHNWHKRLYRDVIAVLGYPLRLVIYVPTRYPEKRVLTADEEGETSRQQE